MRIIGHMVTRNEMGRYLPAAIHELRSHVTDIVAFDDRSDDGTYEYLAAHDVTVGRRSGGSSFASHEGQFRQAAWDFLASAAEPEAGDWILCLDADEFLSLGTFPSLEQALREIPFFTHNDVTALMLSIDEVFDVAPDGTPLIRIDGFWGKISACRLVRWRGGGEFRSVASGGGSVPNAWARHPVKLLNPRILHLGYATMADRQAKYERYRGTTGHSPRHIASIKERGQLVPFGQGVPPALATLLKRAPEGLR
jgi:glycosyltransferase involved in cell wall biosynthesis